MKKRLRVIAALGEGLTTRPARHLRTVVAVATAGAAGTRLQRAPTRAVEGTSPTGALDADDAVEAGVEGGAIATGAAVDPVSEPVLRAKEVVAEAAEQKIPSHVADDVIGAGSAAQNIGS